MPDPIVESIEAVPSADNGNLPVDAPVAPNDPPQEPVAPAEPVAAPTSAESELFELPDGRKVDAATLTKEWKENFLPDYTRKSQALAEKDKGGTPNAPLQSNTTPNTNPLADPNFVPQSYAELAAHIEAQTLAKLEEKEAARIAERQAIEDQVSSQLTEIKASDPTLNENALFLHATKYGFRDLKAAHQNMKDMANLAKNVQKTTADNINKRNDPVSVSPGATGARPDPSNFATAQDFLRSLK